MPLTHNAILARMPKDVPPGVAVIMAKTLAEVPESFNTDWFGTCRMQGLLDWSARGFPEAREFARKWFEYHQASRAVSRFSGPKGRVVDAGGIPITTYAGHFGLSFPCYKLFRQTGDEGRGGCAWPLPG